MIAFGAIVLLLTCLSISILLVKALWEGKGGQGGVTKGFAGGTINRRMDLDSIKEVLSSHRIYNMMRNTHDRPSAALPQMAMTAEGENVT